MNSKSSGCSAEESGRMAEQEAETNREIRHEIKKKNGIERERRRQRITSRGSDAVMCAC
jgi:hypothetical protein